MAKNTKVRKDAEVKEAVVEAEIEVEAEAPVEIPEPVKPVRHETESVQSIELRRRSLLREYKKEKKIPVNISPMYRKHFGNVMTVSIQGITVAIPCDGKTYKINKTHAIEAISRVRKIDNSITRKERMRDITNNFERTPGEIKFY